MKQQNKILAGLLATAFLLSTYNGFSQAAQKGTLSIGVNYFTSNNQIPRVLVKVKTKVDGRFQTVAGIPLKIFLDKDSTGNLIGSIVTNDQGEASTYIPPTLKAKWGKLVKHTFVASFDGNKKFDAGTGDLTVGKAKIVMDVTADKKITATVFEMKDTAWTPVKGVDVKIGVRREGADLPVNETPTFTTDSTGQASADFKRDSIPGDAKGNIILVAKVEDNDQFGNLSIEKSVPWGSKFTWVSTFDQRSLFATRDKAPIWLELIAYSIMFAVWGILVYLVMNILKIKKLAK